MILVGIVALVIICLIMYMVEKSPIFTICLILAMIGAIIIFIVHIKNEYYRFESIARTKMIKVKQTGVSGTVNQAFSYETTFIIYYKNGIHEVETVPNGSIKYNEYVKRIEI